MLKSFSWPEFLLASIILSLIWWAVVCLLYYRKSGNKPTEVLPHSWSDQVDALDDIGLVGKPTLEHGVSIVRADEFSFGHTLSDDEELTDKPAPDKVQQLGELADVQEEIRTVCRILAAEDGSKEDFFTLFEMIRSKYPKLATSPSLPALNQLIQEQLPFELSDQELEALWA